ncbi:RNA polymerase III-inhibiting protein maf1 [Umbelopsis nana]
MVKFLEEPTLEVINQAFTWETAECIITGRVEAYSCKSAGADKKLFKQLESKYSFDITSSSFSPEDRHLNNVVSPFGPLDQAASRKTLFYLLATLNAAFPDYDFSEVRPDQFSKQMSTQMVINSVNTTLFNLGNDVIVNRYRLWDVLDMIVELGDCDVYSFNPDMDDDPMEEEGSIWSLNHFFFNKKLKKIVFFSIRSQSINSPEEDESEFEDDDNQVIGNMEV